MKMLLLSVHWHADMNGTEEVQEQRLSVQPPIASTVTSGEHRHHLTVPGHMTMPHWHISITLMH